MSDIIMATKEKGHYGIEDYSTPKLPNNFLKILIPA